MLEKELAKVQNQLKISHKVSHGVNMKFSIDIEDLINFRLWMIMGRTCPDLKKT